MVGPGSVPVPGIALRTEHSPLYFYHTGEDRGAAFTQSRYNSSSLPRRLVVPTSGQECSVGTPDYCIAALNTARIHTK